MNTKTNDLKEVIKSWIINIDKTEHYCPVKAGKSVFEIVET